MLCPADLGRVRPASKWPTSGCAGDDGTSRSCSMRSRSLESHRFSLSQEPSAARRTASPPTLGSRFIGSYRLGNGLRAGAGGGPAVDRERPPKPGRAASLTSTAKTSTPAPTSRPAAGSSTSSTGRSRRRCSTPTASASSRRRSSRNELEKNKRGLRLEETTAAEVVAFMLTSVPNSTGPSPGWNGC